MNTEKIKTLEQVHDAIDIVEEARAMADLTFLERLDLETASVKLRNLERSIIRCKTNELITSLTADANDLKNLADKITQTAGNLSHIASALEKAARVVEAFINIVATATAAGLL